MGYTEREFRDNLKSEFEDRLPEMKEDHYWQDTIAELADSSVPIYNHDRVSLWLDMGIPEVDDSGLIEGVTDIMQIIGIAIYEQASQYLYELAGEAELK